MGGQKQNLAVIGAQWGDEGKGKIVDLLCESFDVVARYQGGHNAGHTVRFGDKHYSLKLIPSGILHPGKLCLLGNGMVIDPEALLEEVESLRALGVQIDGNLKISESAHCILPYHRALDLAREEADRGWPKVTSQVERIEALLHFFDVGARQLEQLTGLRHCRRKTRQHVGDHFG